MLFYSDLLDIYFSSCFLAPILCNTNLCSSPITQDTWHINAQHCFLFRSTAYSISEKHFQENKYRFPKALGNDTIWLQFVFQAFWENKKPSAKLSGSSSKHVVFFLLFNSKLIVLCMKILFWAKFWFCLDPLAESIDYLLKKEEILLKAPNRTRTHHRNLNP